MSGADFQAPYKRETEMKLMPIALVLAFAAGTAVAFAAEHSISQKGRAFSESAM